MDVMCIIMRLPNPKYNTYVQNYQKQKNICPPNVKRYSFIIQTDFYR